MKTQNTVAVEADRVDNVTSTDFPGHFPGQNHSWSLQRFSDNFQVQIHKLDDSDMEFDLIGLDASIANAFRRILIAEVPTLAIETVFFEMNTSVIQDEVLAHRLGQIPIKAHPDSFRWLEKPEEGEEPKATDYDTVVLKLDAKCEHRKGVAKEEEDPKLKYIGSHVYSGDIIWEPHGQQASWFENDPIRPVNPDILVAKLGPGQEISCIMHCNLGIGQDHAKFSPVSTASYRLLPTIDILKPITGASAEKFAKCFPRGVIDIKEEHGEKVAVVANTRKDTVSRECLRHDEFKDEVKLGRVRDHFIFSVESTGIMSPDELFLKSIRVLKEKCEIVKKAWVEST